MKQILLAISLLLLTSVISPAQAEDIDVKSYPCKEFMSSTEDISFMIFWIDGYLSAMSDQAILNQDWMQSLTKQIISYCKAHPNKSLMDAIEDVE